MPKHYEKKGMVKLKKLSESQKKKLKEHSVQHSKEHMKSMRMNMMRGDSFKEAHNKAMKKVGK